MPSYDELPAGIRPRARRAIVMSIWRHGEVSVGLLSGPVPLEDDEEYLADWATSHFLEFAPDGRVISG